MRTAIARIWRWIAQAWRDDPVFFIGAGLVAMFYIAIGVGPWVAVFTWQRPPLWIGVLAALLAVGVVAYVAVQGFTARYLAVVGRDSPNQEHLHAISWAVLVRTVLAMAWLIPFFALFSSSLENVLHPGRAMVSSDYAGLALWQVADVVPVLDLPAALGQPAPPVLVWGAAVGTGIVIIDLVVIYSIVFVVTELVVRRTWHLPESQ